MGGNAKVESGQSLNISLNTTYLVVRSLSPQIDSSCPTNDATRNGQNRSPLSTVQVPRIDSTLEDANGSISKQNFHCDFFLQINYDCDSQRCHFM
jgi:hypothetical protein